MPIYRCNKCGFVSEDTQTPVGTQTACGRCGTPSTVYGTVFFVEELVKRLATLTRDFKALQTQQAAPAPAVTAPAPVAAPATAFPTLAPAAPDAASAAHMQLAQWFAGKGIEARIDPQAADTSGFFDEAAAQLGQNYELFAELLDRVRYAYRKSYPNVNLDLSQLAQKDGQTIAQFCRSLYQHTLFARYHYQKPEKIVRLTLQTAPAVRQFFDGGWLEWYALTQLLPNARQQSGFAYARNIQITFPNEDLHEIDVMCLPVGQTPICIECKSGEFRRDIDKYLRLSKRLGLSKNRFIICATDLSQEQAKGLSAMYELSFVHLQGLKSHLHTLLQAA